MEPSGHCLDFMSCYHVKEDDLLYQKVTRDEKLVHYFTTKIESSSKQWLAKGDNHPMKAKWERSTDKITYGILGEPRHIVGGIHPKRCPSSDTLLHLRNTIKKKHPGKLSQSVILLHGSARPQKTQLITFLLSNLPWDVFGHPMHSSDLAPTNYYLFANLHQWLERQGFSSNAEVKAVVHNYF